MMNKRKRSPSDSPPQVHPVPQPPPPSQSGNGTVQINFMSRARPDKLRLIDGDSETFGDVLSLIDDYEGVLQRHESLASNLGARLVGPMLLKSIEKMFDGPIKLINSYGSQPAPVSWYDIVVFARSHPGEFNLSENPDGEKICQFWINSTHVEICEDDYRLIMSGGPERMIPPRPVPEDEAAELATMNILEARLAMLIKKADAVASKARQLNYHLKGHKAALQAGKAQEVESPTQTNIFPHHQTIRTSYSAAPEVAKIQQDLLHQFTSPSNHSPHESSQPKYSRLVHSQSPTAFPAFIPPQPPSTATPPTTIPNTARQSSYPLTNNCEDDPYRSFMSTKIEKLNRGDVIYPPCDRCRRLKYDCTKHLSACAPCTKKHARCSWKDARHEELYRYDGSPVKAETDAGGLVGTGGKEHSPSSNDTTANGNGNKSLPLMSNRPVGMGGGPEDMADENTILSRIASAASTGQK
ncbi:hypothetical protein F5884DRAFT_876615 [Xylogone sp. PMI_703]|nr:hypothetical protein F5884DRAFT_876615 [Xylogone sp. PMI_703]